MAVEARRSESKLWTTISDIVTQEGLRLFDIEEPQGGSVLRVYITASDDSSKSSSPRNSEAAVETDKSVANDSDQSSGDDGEGEQVSEIGENGRGVGFDDCTRVCRRLLDVDELEPFIPEGCLLEVSSPGVNRRLRYGDHFDGAVGERIKMKFRDAEGVMRTIVGTLEKFDGVLLSVVAEGRDETISCTLNDIKDARVDFLFDDQKKTKK